MFITKSVFTQTHTSTPECRCYCILKTCGNTIKHVRYYWIYNVLIPLLDYVSKYPSTLVRY